MNRLINQHIYFSILNFETDLKILPNYCNNETHARSFVEGKVYWGEDNGDRLKVANTDGSNVVLLDDGPEPNDIVVYYNYLYFVDNDDGTLWRIPKQGGSPVTVVPSNTFTLPEGLHIEFSKF